MSELMENIKTKKKQHRSLFYRISAWLHLWLGLISGIIVVIVCANACIWVFNEEITTYLLEPETRIEHQHKPVLAPGDIYGIARRLYPEKQIVAARYIQGRTVNISISDSREPEAVIKVDPYTGKVISNKKGGGKGARFFRCILNGHRFLWLPYKIGRPIVNYSILIFAITLITGLILWYPKKWSKSTREKSFKIKFGASFKRVNYDFHNVLGFYTLLVLLILSLTGIFYGLEWFGKGLYWVTSAGKVLPTYEKPQSDTLNLNAQYRMNRAIDMAWYKVLSENSQAKGFYINFPDTTRPGSTINITAYYSVGKTYDNISYTFDRYTIRQMPKHPINGMRLQSASFAVSLRKMNYDIHTGSILGLP